MFGNLCYAPRCGWTSWYKWQKLAVGNCRVSVPPLWAQIPHCRIPLVPQIYRFSAGSGPHRGRHHYCRVQWTRERMLTTHIQGEEESPCSNTTPGSDRMGSQGHRTLCTAAGLSLSPERLSDKPLLVAPVASSCALSNSHFVFNIFITTFWQDALCTHFSYVYTHITQTRAYSNKYLWVPSNHLSAASFSPSWTVHRVQEHKLFFSD